MSAIRTLGEVVPASAPRCALSLIEGGLTTGALHPATVRLLATAWGLPRPVWHWDVLKGVPSLFVGPGWPAHRLALGRVVLSVRRAGVVGLPAGEAALGRAIPGLRAGQAVDLLIARGLHTPGSTVVWDHSYPGSRLLTLLTRMIAALGPLPAETAAASLTRARTGNRVDRLAVTGDHLVALAREHPWLQVTEDDRLDTHPGSPGRQVLPPRDRAVVSSLGRRGGSGSTVELRDRLVGRGAFPSSSAAEYFLYTRPYLRSPRPGVIALLTAEPPVTPAGALASGGTVVSAPAATLTQ